jgi:hypothetical protein
VRLENRLDEMSEEKPAIEEQPQEQNKKLRLWRNQTHYY